jgi:hypothetical protein
MPFPLLPLTSLASLASLTSLTSLTSLASLTSLTAPTPAAATGQVWAWGMSKSNMFGVPTIPGIKGIAKLNVATRLPVRASRGTLGMAFQPYRLCLQRYDNRSIPFLFNLSLTHPT